MASAVIQADTHVFGSTSGYKTVAASRGVRDDEKRELESFQFGEASTADRIARLETHAVMTGRALRSGRFAISRMMPAGVDDAGRPTIEVITLIVEPRDYGSCIGSLELFAADPGFWRAARASAAAGTAVPARAASADPRDPQVLRMFDLWRAAVRFGALGVVPEAQSSDVFRLVASLDPSDRARCRWGIGLLSVSAPADICSLASGTSTHGARDVMRPAQPGAWHCGGETEYAAFRVSSGLRSFPTVADIEQNGRSLVVEAGQTEMRTPTRTAVTRPASRERRLMPFAIGSAVLSTVVLGVAITMYAGRNKAPVVVPAASGAEQATRPVEPKPDLGVLWGGASRSRARPSIGSEPTIDPKPTDSSPPGVPPAPAEPDAPAGPPPSAEPTSPPPADPGPPAGPPPSAEPTSPPPADPGPPADPPPSAEPTPPPPADPTPPQAQEEKSISEFIEWVKSDSFPKLRWPASDPDQLSQVRARRQAEDLAKECAKRIRYMVEQDKVRKAQANKLKAEGKGRSAVIEANGFVARKNDTGPGGSNKDDWLNLALLKQWKQALVALRDRLPLDEADKELRASWNQGLAAELSSDKNEVVEWLLHIDSSAKKCGFMIELLTVERVIEKRERENEADSEKPEKP